MKSKKKEKPYKKSDYEAQLENVWALARQAYWFLEENAPDWTKDLDEASFEVSGSDREKGVQTIRDILEDVTELREYLLTAEWELTDFIHKFYDDETPRS